jgi:abortive infection bacteriophage resistance protein
LSEARNLCAHDERLYNIQLRNDSKIFDTIYHTKLKIAKNKGNFTQGKDDFFAIIVSLKDLLPKRDFKKFVKEINNDISNLEKHLKSISIDVITLSMGLPNNWFAILNM